MENKDQPKIVTSPHPDWSFSFNCPEDWEVRETPVKSGVKFFLRGPLNQAETLFAAITVRARSGKSRILSGLDCEWVGRRRAFRTFRILARTETDLAGCDAIQIDAALEAPLPMHAVHPKLVTVRERVVFALRDEKIYELTYRATQDDFEANLPVFEALVASFSLESVYLT